MTLEVQPDLTKVEKQDPLTAALKAHNLPLSYRTKPPSERSKNYHTYLKAKAEAEGNAAKHTLRLSVTNDTPPYSVVTDPTEAARIINSLRGKAYSYDYETTGLDPYQARIVGLALADEQHSWYLAREGLAALPEFRSLLTDKSTTPAAHNSKYEYKINATNLGIDPLDVVPARDSMVMHWLLNCGNQYTYDNGLKSVTRRRLGRNVLEFGDVVPDFKKTLEAESYGSAIEKVQSTDEGLDLVARYAAAGDARNTWDLVFSDLGPALHQANLLDVYNEFELNLTPVLAEIELAGLLIDQSKLRELYISLVQDQAQLEQDLRALGFQGNLGSGEQVAHWFYKDLGLPVLATTSSGRGKVDATTLDKLRHRHPAVLVYSQYTKITKLLSTFVVPYLTAGIDHLYPSLNQTSTGTGRLSSSGPNLQNWPLKMRDMVIPPEGEIIWGRDYSQIEPRIASVASGDPSMLKAYRNNEDPYIELGLDMGFDREKVITKEPSTRKIIKGAFLGWMYGARGPKLVETVAKQDVRISVVEANRYIEQLEQARPVFVKWRNDVVRKAHTTGASFSLYGRRRLLPKIHSQDPTYRAEAEREAVNMVCQGSAADIIKRAMPAVQRLLKQVGGTLRNQVHDELVGTWPERYENELGMEINRIMEDSELIPLKVEAEWGPTWAAAKPH